MNRLRLRRSLVCCALFSGALALSPHAQTVVSTPPVLDVLAVSAQEAAPLFAVPETGMLIKGGPEGQLSLRAFLREFGSITGETFLYDPETAQLLDSATPGLDRDIRVDATDMYGVMQDLLVQNRFVLVDVRRQAPRLLRVVAVQSRVGQLLRGWAKFVPEDELDAYAANTAMLVTTSMHLPNLNENDVSNRLRVLTVDNNLERITAVPGTQQVILTGPAAQVGEWARLLRELNSRATPPEEPKQG